MIAKCIVEQDWFKDSAALHVYIYLASRAVWKDTKVGDVSLALGDVLASRNDICLATGLTEKQVRRCVTKLIDLGIVRAKLEGQSRPTYPRVYSVMTAQSYVEADDDEQPSNEAKGGQARNLTTLLEEDHLEERTPLPPQGEPLVLAPKITKHKKGTPFTKVEQFKDSGAYIPTWLAAFQTWLDYRVEIGKPIRAANALKITFEKFQTADELKASVEQSIMNGWQGLFPARSVVVQKESWIDRRLRELKAEEEAEEAHSTQLKALGGSRCIDLRGSNGKGRVQ